MLRFLASVIVFSRLTSGVLGDTIVLADGRHFDGVLLSQNAEMIRFEVHHQGIRMVLNISADDVVSLRTVERAGTPYVRVPIHGQIGRSQYSPAFVTADGLDRALRRARRTGATHVILDIDSSGGSITEMQLILEVLQQYPELTFVAHVKKALSAAAIVALACESISMTQASTIGATVPWRVGPDKTPQNIEEKFISSLRATIRSTAQAGQHDVLLARGMIDPDLQLYAIPVDFRSFVVTDVPAEGATVIKERGKILALTADESLMYGLASAVTASVDEVLEAAGAKPGYEVDDLCWHMVLNSADAEFKRMEQAQERALQQAEREDYIQRTRSRVDEIKSRLQKLKAVLAAAEYTERDLVTQYDREMQSAFDRSQEMRRQPYFGAAADALEWYEDKTTAIKTRYDPQLSTVRQGILEAIAEETLLLQELTDWKDNLPKVD